MGFEGELNGYRSGFSGARFGTMLLPSDVRVWGGGGGESFGVQKSRCLIIRIGFWPLL